MGDCRVWYINDLRDNILCYSGDDRRISWLYKVCRIKALLVRVNCKPGPDLFDRSGMLPRRLVCKADSRLGDMLIRRSDHREVVCDTVLCTLGSDLRRSFVELDH